MPTRHPHQRWKSPRNRRRRGDPPKRTCRAPSPGQYLHGAVARLTPRRRSLWLLQRRHRQRGDRRPAHRRPGSRLPLGLHRGWRPASGSKGRHTTALCFQFVLRSGIGFRPWLETHAQLSVRQVPRSTQCSQFDIPRPRSSSLQVSRRHRANRRQPELPEESSFRRTRSQRWCGLSPAEPESRCPVPFRGQGNDRRPRPSPHSSSSKFRWPSLTPGSHPPCFRWERPPTPHSWTGRHQTCEQADHPFRQRIV